MLAPTSGFRFSANTSALGSSFARPMSIIGSGSLQITDSILQHTGICNSQAYAEVDNVLSNIIATLHAKAPAERSG
jgi:hypothetical protein